jgi:hypothetical protein
MTAMTKMLYNTSDKGLKPTRTHNFISTDPKEVVLHLKKGGLTLGYSCCFAVNHTTGQVVEMFKKGPIYQKDVKPLIEKGFTEWLFSYAFYCSIFELPSGRRVHSLKAQGGGVNPNPGGF